MFSDLYNKRFDGINDRLNNEIDFNDFNDGCIKSLATL